MRVTHWSSGKSKFDSSLDPGLTWNLKSELIRHNLRSLCPEYSRVAQSPPPSIHTRDKKWNAGILELSPFHQFKPSGKISILGSWNANQSRVTTISINADARYRFPPLPSFLYSRFNNFYSDVWERWVEKNERKENELRGRNVRSNLVSVYPPVISTTIAHCVCSIPRQFPYWCNLLMFAQM